MCEKLAREGEAGGGAPVGYGGVKRNHRRLEFDSMNDADLTLRAQGGDVRATETLLNRYRPLARAKARSFFVPGCDRDDVVQEAMIGLCEAIRNYDATKRRPFWVFANVCVTRQILTAVQSANRRKRQVLNSSLSFDAITPTPDGESVVLSDALMAPSVTFDPFEMVIAFEEVKALQVSMREQLTPLERDVLDLHMKGKSYKEMASILGNRVKAVDNALQRVRCKAQHHLDQRNDLAR